MLSSFSTNIQIKKFHTKFHQNRIINEDFEILGEGERIGGKELSIFSLSLTKIHIKMIHTRFYKNRMIQGKLWWEGEGVARRVTG